MNFQKRADNNNKSAQSISGDSTAKYIVDVLLHCSDPASGGSGGAQTPQGGDTRPKPCPPGQQGVYKVVPVLLPLLDGLSAVRIYVPKDLRTHEGRQSVAKSIAEVQKRFENEGGIPLLDPVEDMEIDDEKFKRLVRKIETLESRLYSNKLYKEDDGLEEKFKLYDRKVQLETEIKNIKKQLRSAGDIILKDDLKGMKKVLRKLGFTNAEDVVQVKGRVACEISAGDELLLTELMFQGLFNTLDVDHTVALCSCFAFEEKGETPQMKDDLLGPYRQLQETARRIAKVSADARLRVEEEEYVNSFKPQMMDVVLAWSKGAKFSEICKMTDVYEGSIIRSMRRLEELIRQLSQSARAIGNTELEDKFAQGILKIKRDIVFAASLYL